MENLTVQATKSSPYIFFDAQHGILEIKGKSYPENAARFYAPVFESIRSYVQSTDNALIQVTMEIIYLNSSSSKALLNLFDLLDTLAKSGRSVMINWIYQQGDETSLECGEEFREDLEAVVFNLVEKTEG